MHALTYCGAACRETTSLKLAKLRGVTFVNQYVVIKYLGKGANGRVFLCLDMCDNRLYAVKVKSLSKSQLHHAERGIFTKHEAERVEDGAARCLVRGCQCRQTCGVDAHAALLQIVKKTDVESARGRKRRNPLNDLKREVAIMRTLRHKNIVALQVTHICLPFSLKIAQHTPTLHG